MEMYNEVELLDFLNIYQRIDGIVHIFTSSNKLFEINENNYINYVGQRYSQKLKSRLEKYLFGKMCVINGQILIINTIKTF